MIRFLTGLSARVWAILVTILSAAAVIAKVIFMGRKLQETKDALDDAQDYIETRKRIDEADDIGNDPDAGRRWLHERGKSGRNL